MSYSALFDKTRPVPFSQTYAEVKPLLQWVYAWMGIGLLVTAVVAVFTASSPALVEVRANPVIAIGSFIAQIALVLVLSFAMPRLSPGLAAVLFMVYAALMGFSLSLILLVFNIGSIAAAFATTSILFFAMTMFALTTNIDLTRFGGLFMMALIGLFIAILVNLFLQSSFIDFIISIFGVLLFMGLTAYDTQNLKRMAATPEIMGDRAAIAKVSIFGALGLYINFINIFLFLLQLMGGNNE